ncbi:MAG: Efflux transporter, RND family, MFP subunit [Parcubacteria group bacterium GW2011_GWC2_39_14]|nr:MAG: Efflux transporter, RND family, MFP subunit [Parcubacteria group bacterium GW2011_GWC2_39_14]
MIEKSKILIKWHKIISIVIVLIVLVSGYYLYKHFSTASVETRYQFATVEKGTIIKTISGSGQVVATNQVDIKPKASGEVIRVAVKKGQDVKAGAILVQLDAGDAWRTVRDAQLSLKSAQLAYDEVKNGATEAELTQSENSLTAAKTTVEKLKLSQQNGYQDALEAEQKLRDSVTKSYEDMFNSITDAFLDFPDVISGLNEVLYSKGIASSEGSIDAGTLNTDALINTITKDTDKGGIVSSQILAENNYDQTRPYFDSAFIDYRSITRYSDQTTLKTFLDRTIELTRKLFETAKSESNFIDSWVDLRTQEDQQIFSKVTSYQSDLSGYLSTINSDLSSLLAVKSTLDTNISLLAQKQRDIETSIKNNPLDLAAAEASLKEKQIAYNELKAGATESDLLSQEISLGQRRNSLYDAQETYADYTVRAPFDGVVAVCDLVKGDMASSGTAAVTLMTKQQTAVISLNEVDVAQVAVGQKSNITFDALPDLNITGQVAELDSLGTTSQGVVSYEVKILFDVQDERIKPGMSVSVTITTDLKQDILLVPNAAIKSSGDTNYVETPAQKLTDENAFSSTGIILSDTLNQQNVEVGISNDSDTEIVSGLKEGDQVLIKTINATSTTTQTKSILQAATGSRSGLGVGMRPD